MAGVMVVLGITGCSNETKVKSSVAISNVTADTTITVEFAKTSGSSGASGAASH